LRYEQYEIHKYCGYSSKYRNKYNIKYINIADTQVPKYRNIYNIKYINIVDIQENIEI